ncbi:archaeosortase A [Halorientalis halophila]|uniref:archaeosortase A n=1 Tax=Halorientalis halophila TaxID=3108499 RepID=UPI00300986BE
MQETVLGALAWVGQFSDPLAWLVIAAFGTGAVLDWYDWHRDAARTISVAAWVLFALFWFTQIHHFAFVQKSIVEGIGTLVAVPASLYVALLLHRGRDSLLVLSRAVAVMGAVFLPFEAILVLQELLIEAVTRQTEFLMGLLGYHPEVIPGSEVKAEYEAFRNTFVFYPEENYRITYTIIIACTGIGSMAIFVGLIAAVRAPLNRKLRALAVSIPVIYALNLVRNVFIGLSFGTMKMQLVPEATASLFAFDLAADPGLVSYYWADRIIAQSASVVALVAITWLVVRELPEVLIVIEDLLYMATGSEYDLRGALGVPVARADGE